MLASGLSAAIALKPLVPVLQPTVVAFMSPIYVALGFPLIIAAEAVVFTRSFHWRALRAILAAFIANILTDAVLFFGGGLLAFLIVDYSGVWGWGLSLWWAPMTIALWLAFYIITVAVKWLVFNTSARGARQKLGSLRVLKVTALVNIVFYLVMLPLWLNTERPRLYGAHLVHRSKWLPGITELFAYQNPDGEIRLASTRGEQIAKIGDIPRTDRSFRIAYRTSDDGHWLTAYLFIEPEYLGWDNEPRYAPPPKEILLARFDLTTLPKEYRTSIAPAAAFGVLALDENGDYLPVSRSHRRDGTLAEVHPKPIFIGIWTGLDKGSITEPDNLPPSFGVMGSPGVSSRHFWFWSPHVLPGGRYILFQCSGEIMVLDVETRKVVRLFPGYNPVALSSLEPQSAEPPEEEPRGE